MLPCELPLSARLRDMLLEEGVEGLLGRDSSVGVVRVGVSASSRERSGEAGMNCVIEARMPGLGEEALGLGARGRTVAGSTVWSVIAMAENVESQTDFAEQVLSSFQLRRDQRDVSLDKCPASFHPR